MTPAQASGRTMAIVQDAVRHLRMGESVLVIVASTSEIERLAQMAVGFCPQARRIRFADVALDQARIRFQTPAVSTFGRDPHEKTLVDHFVLEVWE